MPLNNLSYDSILDGFYFSILYIRISDVCVRDFIVSAISSFFFFFFDKHGPNVCGKTKSDVCLVSDDDDLVCIKAIYFLYIFKLIKLHYNFV